MQGDERREGRGMSMRIDAGSHSTCTLSGVNAAMT
jgi:hypothetical protein